MIFRRMSERYIKKALKGTEYEISVKRTLTSTNALMKEAAVKGGKEFSVIIAEEQTAGRGRMGRSFYSPKNSGVYLSVLLRPQMNKNALLITTDAAVCCCRVFEKMTGQETRIKWVNDIYMDNKKVCGILTEGGETYAVLGIGINVTPPSGGFPEDIKDRAGAVFKRKELRLRENTVIEFLKEFMNIYINAEREEYFKEYKERSLVIGREIEIIKNTTTEKAVVLGLNKDYSLLVRKENGETESLSSGDVRIKI